MGIKLHNLASLFRNTRSRTMILVTLALIVFVIFLGVYRFSRQIAGHPGTAQLQVIGGIQSIPGGVNQPSSIEHMRLQEQQNLQQSQTAARTGDSAIATIVDSITLRKEIEPSTPCPSPQEVTRMHPGTSLYPSKLQSGTLIFDDKGNVIGTVDKEGKVRDSKRTIIGQVGPDGLVRDSNGAVIGRTGAAVNGLSIVDGAGHLVGTVGQDGKVRDINRPLIGKLGPDGIVRDEDRLGLEIGGDPEIQAILDRQTTQLTEQKSELLKQQMKSAMSGQIGQLFGVWGTVPAQQAVVGTPSPDTRGAVLISEGEATGREIGREPAVKTGTIMHAILLTSVNSDEPGPVLAKVVEGKFKGGRLIGTLSNLGERVLLQFNRLNLSSFPQSISISTVAIDSHTARTALSSSTDRHLLLRYGSLFASSFLQGYGQAFQLGGAIINAMGSRTIATYPQLDPTGRFIVALGNVGTQFSSALGRQFATPPTVHVYAGTAVGILFTEDVPAFK